MDDTRVYFAMSFGVTSVQFMPPFLVSQTRPSSVPAQMYPAARGDSWMMNTVL